MLHSIKKISLFLIGLVYLANSSATIINKDLFVNSGEFVTVKLTTFPFLAFNETDGFNSVNAVFNCSTGDTIIFNVHNNDDVIHGFAIKGYIGTPLAIAPGDSATFTFYSSEESIFIYYDQLNYPDNRYMGLGGMICVNNSASIKYYWNLKEYQTEFNNDIDAGLAVNWNNYIPDYFTINSRSYPDTQSDTTAAINVNVGDTILIFIANTGQSEHSIHFHGFHSKVLYSTGSRIRKDWVKDTWPIEQMEGVILQLIPDKPGRYSVHDHNLLAMSGGGTHPYGMFLIMEIDE
ncbi:MAG: multicopper oxidase domain-containing protein [Chitinophagales bacterium]